MPPACARQATGDSVGPQVDVAERPGRNLLAVRDVGELEPPIRFQYTHNFGEDPALVGAKIDDAVADDGIRRAVFDRQVLDHAVPKLDIAQTHRGGRGARSAKHFLGHVDANDVTFGPDLTGRDKAVETASGAEIDDPLA